MCSYGLSCGKWGSEWRYKAHCLELFIIFTSNKDLPSPWVLLSSIKLWAELYSCSVGKKIIIIYSHKPSFISVNTEGKSKLMSPTNRGISQNICGCSVSKVPFQFTIFPIMCKLNLQFYMWGITSCAILKHDPNSCDDDTDAGCHSLGWTTIKTTIVISSENNLQKHPCQIIPDEEFECFVEAKAINAKIISQQNPCQGNNFRGNATYNIFDQDHILPCQS